jgi:hypothetical protein
MFDIHRKINRKGKTNVFARFDELSIVDFNRVIDVKYVYTRSCRTLRMIEQRLTHENIMSCISLIFIRFVSLD